MHETSEDNQSLWLLTVAPLFWAAHFLLSYITAAVYCAKYAGPMGSLHGVRVAVGIYTAVALVGILITGWIGCRRMAHPADPGDTQTRHQDTPEDRHRFLGFATLLLSGLSGIAVIFVALVVCYLKDCR